MPAQSTGLGLPSALQLLLVSLMQVTDLLCDCLHRNHALCLFFVIFDSNFFLGEFVEWLLALTGFSCSINAEWLT